MNTCERTLEHPPSVLLAAVPPGHVYFWAEPGQVGPGGAWDYAPPHIWATGC
ncbi:MULTISPECIES: hypothetical protein [Streptomyces]|nr:MULTISPECIES: hypothetical protein [Streptomyces]MYT07323.1 hypothetical protein [Streptomyces sp. SID5470]